MRQGSERGAGANGASTPAYRIEPSSVHSKTQPPSSVSSYAYINGNSTPQSTGSIGVAKDGHATTVYGHDREEVARLMIQALQDLGYNHASEALVRESGYELESPAVAAFRTAILNGEWAEAETLIFGPPDQSQGGAIRVVNGHTRYLEPLHLIDGVDQNEFRFLLRRQKYLELLEQQDQTAALMVLRQELTPLHRDVAQLHHLSSLVVCPVDDLKVQMGQDGTAGSSRALLLAELSKSISPSVMVPEHRLLALLDQVKHSQISRCHYHNPTTSLSLFADHACDRNQFPLQAIVQLSQSQEVWFLEFSHAGTQLATCGQSSSIIIYDTQTFRELRVLSGHQRYVAYVAWSPDDSRLISCSHDKTARLWDMTSGKCISVLANFEEPKTSAAWAPDGQTFITGSLDKKCALNLWTVTGEKLYTWPVEYRIQDLAVSPDGRWLVTISVEKQLYVYNLESRAEEYSLKLKTDMTCVSIDRESKQMLVNMADNELQLFDIATAENVQVFRGQKQGMFVIRSTFGGADENLIISGSEDGKIYIFHRERGTIIETLDGHLGGCVNAVAWNPTDLCMFASAGDDKKIRIWSKPAAHTNGHHVSQTTQHAIYGSSMQL